MRPRYTSTLGKYLVEAPYNDKKKNITPVSIKNHPLIAC